jgi:hypothetical protein
VNVTFSFEPGNGDELRHAIGKMIDASYLADAAALPPASNRLARIEAKLANIEQLLGLIVAATVPARGDAAERLRRLGLLPPVKADGGEEPGVTA